MCLSFLHTWITLLFALLLLLLLQVCCIRMQATSIQIETKLGSIVGQQTRFEDVDLFTFYGIPYGESTGGSRRFLSSKLRNDLPSSPYFATNYTVHCPIGYVPRLDNAPMSEDCLHANIWMPKRSEFTLSDRNVLSTCGQVSLPVLVYLYGGEGSIFMLDHESSHLMYDGSAYAAFGDMIFVTINYRAGAFGQLAIPNQIPGNAGLFDQTVALQWIQKHIGHFCGDIRRVTLMGNSYGSMAAGLHLLSHKSAPYFSQVIMQSGSPLFSPYLPDFPDEAYEKSLALADKFGCTRSHLKQSKRIDLGCLQQIPMQSLVDELEWLQPFLMFGGDFFEANTIRQYEQKDQFEIAPDKRLVLGLVTNEVCISSVPLNTFIEKFNREPNLSKKQIERVMSKVVEFVRKCSIFRKIKSDFILILF